MHTFEGKQALFHFNGGGDGDVVITTDGGGVELRSLTVPVEDVVAFVAELVRRRRIAALEQATDEQIIGMPPLPEA